MTKFDPNTKITTRLMACAAQENCDSEEYDLMQEAAEYIDKLIIALEMFNEPHCNYIPKLDCTIDQLLGKT